VANAWTEAEKIAEIWRAALLDENLKGKDDLLARYIRLLQFKFYNVADIYSIEDFLSEDIAKLVWAHILKAKTTLPPFYYCGS